MYITEQNRHIEDYLNYYSQLTHAPKFALLLKGQWGSGKTWFINQYREKLNQEKKKTLYVSLYGVSSYSDIEDLLFQQIHPILSSKGMVILGQALKGLAKGTLKIDLNKDGQDDGTLSLAIPEIEISKKFKDSTFSLLIFDDLERCNIDIAQVLGYINSFVESQDLKIVIIANEDEINSASKEYKRIKEKLIGKTFEIFPDFKSAINDFLAQIQDKEVKKVVLSKTDYIFNLFKKAECNNLRILHQIILDFERIFNALPEKIVKQIDSIQEIIEILTILSIEISSGNIQPKEIDIIDKSLNDRLMSSISSHVTNNKNSPNKDTDKKDLSGVFDKYEIKASLFTSKEWFPNLSWWKIFFDKGIVNKEILESVISTSKYFQDENTPNWLNLLNYSKQSDDEFKIILEKVCLEYENRIFEDIGIIKQITGMLLFFSGAKLYSIDKNDILEDAKQYIEFLISQDKLNSKYSNEDNYMGTMFFAIDTDEFKEFDNYIKQMQEKVRLKNMSKVALKLMDTMMSDITAFHAKICVDSIRTDIKERYYNFPLFSYLPPNIFLERLLSLSSNEDKQYVFYSLQKRYELINSYPELANELDFLKNFQDLLEKEVSNRQGVLSGFILGSLNSEYLAKTINLLEQKKNMIETNKS